MTVKGVLLVEGLVNLLVMLSKLFVGLSTGSAAIIADAIHSLTDLFNNIVAWMAVHIAQKPADADHHYGHQKFEALAVFFLATLLCVVAIEVVLNAISRFGDPVEQDKIGLAIMIVAALTSGILSFWQKRWAKRLNSDILHADASHTFSDLLTTAVVILGWQLAAAGFYWVDTLFAICVAVIVAYLAFNLFLRAIPSLVDQTSKNAWHIRQRLMQNTDVLAVKNLRIRSYSGQHVADLVIRVDRHKSLIESHQIADWVESVLEKEFSISDVSVHMEPELKKHAYNNLDEKHLR